MTLAAKLLVLSPADQTIKFLSQYVFSLARYDLNYDVRDRGRMLSTLVSGLLPSIVNGVEQEPRTGVVLRREQVKMVLFDGKSAVEDNDMVGFCTCAILLGAIADLTWIIAHESALLGSMSLVTGKSMSLDAIMPDWLERGVESSLRDTEEEKVPPAPAPVALSSTPQGIKGTPPAALTPSGGSSAGTSTKKPWTDLDEFYADTDKEEEEEDDEDGDDDGDDDEDDEEGDEGEESQDEDDDESVGGSEQSSEDGESVEQDDGGVHVKRGSD